MPADMAGNVPSSRGPSRGGQGSALGSRVAVLFIACSLAVSFYSQVKLVAARGEPDNLLTFRNRLTPANRCWAAWKGRVVPMKAAAAFTSAIAPDDDSAVRAIAAWSALWLLAVFVVLHSFPGPTLTWIFGTYAALAFSYNPIVGSPRAYAWDLPILFVATIATAFLARRRESALIWVVPLGVLMKETSIVFSIPLLFAGGRTRRERVRLFLTTAGAGLVVKVALDAAMGGPILATMMPAGISENAGLLLSLSSSNPLFSAGGLLVALVLVPSRDPLVTGIKVMAAVFGVGILTFGVIDETRIFSEMIPPALLALYLGGSSLAAPRSRAVTDVVGRQAETSEGAEAAP